MQSADTLSLWWADVKTGLGVLTRLPVGREHPEGATDLARAARVFPLIGALIGLVGAVVFWLGDALDLPPLASGLLAVGATILFTGAFHEDGLSDVADGFAGAFTRERKLAIMRDSRIGVFGTTALVLSIGLRAAALGAIAEPGAAAAALVAAHALARSCVPAVMATLPLARPDGLAAAAGRPGPGQAGVALAFGAAMAVLLLGLGTGLLALAAAGLAVTAMALVARAQIGGYSGDVLGAVEQLGEAVVLLAAAAAAS